MTKKEAIALMDMSPAEITASIGITRQYWYKIPEQLNFHHVNQLIGLCVRLDKPVPEQYIGDMCVVDGVVK